MDNWRKNQRISNHNQVGQWRSSSSSYYGKPPLDNRFPTLPLWEKQFCASVGSVPWQKLIEGKRYMYMHPKVVNWDDSAVKEAFNNAKNRYWAEINGIPWDIPLPDPNIYIDDVDSNASVDRELYLDVVTEAEACHNIEEKGEATVILGSSLLLKQSSSGLGLGPTGWGDEEDEKLTKPSEPNYAALGWESTHIWEQYHSLVEHAAKEYGWQNGQNDSQGWNQRERYGGDSHNKYQGRNSGRGNWGTWDGFNRKKENNMSWYKNPGYHHGTNEYKMIIGGRRNGGRGGGGGRRGNFAVKEAFNNTKNRFWAEINDIPCDISLPDPNIYIDDVNWNASVDPELYLDVEREAEARHNMEEKGEEVVILGSSLLLDQSFSGPGWGDEEDEKLTKPSEPNYVALGWESNQHENNETNFWEQYHTPVEHAAKEYGWQNGQNDSQGWNQREQYGGDLHNKYQGKYSGNWGAWDGYNRKKENNISWLKNPGYHDGTNEYQMNSGRRRNGGRGGRGGGGRR